MVVGTQAVITAMEEGKALDRIYLSQKATGEGISRVRNMAIKLTIPINYVPIEKLNGFNAGDHEGCVALLSRVHYHNLQEVISWVVEKGEVPLFVILDGITDIRNI